MKISQVSFSKLGGAGKVAGLLFEELGKMGHDSTFRTFSESNLRSDPLSQPITTLMAGIDEFIVKKSSVDSQFSLLRDFKSGYKSLNTSPDIVNLHWVTGALSFAQIQKITGNGVGLFWTLHDMRPFTGGCHHSGECVKYMTSCSQCPQAKSAFHDLVQLNLANKLKYSFLKDATIVAPSSWIADSASNSAVFRNSNLIVIPNPIHEVFFSPKIPALPRPPSLPTSIVFSLIATDLGDPNKRVAEVCEALSAVELTSPGIDIKLVLIGARGGKFADKYRFVSLLGVLDAIGIVQILDTIDANISFSIVETSPLTIAECAARGVPTIASNNKGASAIINSLNCGSTVNDIHDLRLMLEQALQNKVTSGVVGIGSDLMTANAMNSHRPEKVASRYENEYANWKIGRRGPNK